ncbi:FeoB-associated Cys-rich membrane protein [Psychroflexus gondwanensis]|nr:FeoB-associated Cys-rich membrane protein [Psychroflexus gondwanensis]
MLQEILVLLIFMTAVAFLIKKFFFKSKTASSSCGSGDCGCKD